MISLHVIVRAFAPFHFFVSFLHIDPHEESEVYRRSRQHAATRDILLKTVWMFKESADGWTQWLGNLAEGEGGVLGKG